MAETLANTNGALTLKQATAFNRPFYFGTLSQTVSVFLSKNGGAWAAAAGAVTEIGGAGNGRGWYTVALTNVDTNNTGALGGQGVLAYNCTASSGGPVDFCDTVQLFVVSDFSISGTGQVGVTSNIKQNQAVVGYPFVMTDSTSHAPKPGLGGTITAQRSLGGGGFGSCANAPTEISNGVYAINLAATDTNAGTIMLRLTATGADDLNIAFITQP